MSALISKAQILKFSSEGLNLFPMGSKLGSDVKVNLINIDTSTFEGELEYNLASTGQIIRILRIKSYR